MPVVKVTTSHHHRRRRVRRIGHHDRCLLTLVLVYSTRRHGVCMVVYVQFFIQQDNAQREVAHLGIRL